MKHLKTIRLDGSDALVFEHAAAPGEWAVPGSFRFWHGDAARLEGRARMAFRSGFLGVASFGWSTLAVVAEAEAAAREAAVMTLAAMLVREQGAPDLATARPAAMEEIAFAESLAEHPLGTLVALARTIEAGAVRERFRTLRPKGAGVEHDRAFAFLEIAEAEDAAVGPVDLADLARRG